MSFLLLHLRGPDAITAFASEDASLPDAIGGLLFLKSSIGGLSCPKELHLAWNHFTSLPESLSQLSHLITLVLDDCEVLPELPPSVWNIYACDCTLGSYKDGKTHSGTQCLDSSITSQCSNNNLSAFLGRLGFETKNNEDVEVKECGVRLICEEDIEQGAESKYHAFPGKVEACLKLLDVDSPELLPCKSAFFVFSVVL
ncbi:NB-ARC domains-containing protein [Tanacetum coccineum]